MFTLADTHVTVENALQVATGTLGNGPDPAPQDGDGFTYEHLAHKDELWFDFCADTGDGGDPTYAVARCMAAPQLQVRGPGPHAAGMAGFLSLLALQLALTLSAALCTLSLHLCWWLLCAWAIAQPASTA